MVEILEPPLNIVAGGGANPMLDPAIVKRGVKTRSQNPAWRKSVAEANRKKAQCPAWRKSVAEANRKTVQCPVWRKNTAEAGRKRAQNPAWRKANTEAREKMYKDPAWRKVNAEAREKMYKDPAWRKANAKGHKKLRKPVRATCVATGDVLEFPGQRDAARQMSEKYKKNFDFRLVSAVCCGRQGSHRGWRFEFA